MSASRLSRREFFKGGGAAVVGAASTSFLQQSAAASGEAQILNGHISRIDGSTVTVRDSGGVDRSVETAGCKEFSRAGRTTLGAFEQDDEISAEGEWTGEFFNASSFSMLYRRRDGDVIMRRERRIETTSGVVILHPDVQAARGPNMKDEHPENAASGDHLVAEGWINSADGTLITVRAGVTKAAP